MLPRIGIKNIHLETDSFITVQMITRKQAVKVVHRALVLDILELVSIMEKVWLQFSFREANHTVDKLVDKLATFGNHNAYVYNSFLGEPPI